MKRLIPATLLLLTALCFQSCNNRGSNDSLANADSANAVKQDTVTKKTSKNNIPAGKFDTEFAVNAAGGGMTEVELGRLAEQKGINKRVKNFGAMMVADHSRANDELMALAKRKNISLPSVPGNSDQKTIDRLSRDNGKAFDKAYVDDMIEDHQNDIKEFEQAVKNCSDAEIRTFAQKTLPVLQNHLEAINTIHSSMK